MPKITYKTIQFTEEKMRLIKLAIGIVREYSAQGYDLTLRQVYYQFVARDQLPASWADKETGSTNNQRSYKRLGDLLADARLGGMMDWKSMVDRTREMDGNQHWSSPERIIDAVARSYAIDKWQDQKYRPEVWVEKDALEGVVGQICRQLDIPFFSCRGYTSLTSIWSNAQRLKAVAESGQIPVVLHLGDHDPSGIDMSRDIEDRVAMFMDKQGKNLKFERLALNMDQVTRYAPPENPAKSTDSRYRDYRDKHGESSWELDALEPSVISGIIEKAVKKLRDDIVYQVMERREAEERKLLKETSMRWDSVVEFIEHERADDGDIAEELDDLDEDDDLDDDTDDDDQEDTTP